MLSDDPDTLVEHRPEACACCGASLHAALPAEVVSVAEQIELPAVAPIVTQHHRLAVRCPRCGERVVAPVPEAARGTPFGPRLHAVATYLKTFQALSYERLQGIHPAKDAGATVSSGADHFLPYGRRSAPSARRSHRW